VHGIIHGNRPALTFSTQPVAMPITSLSESVHVDEVTTTDWDIASTASAAEDAYMHLGFTKLAAEAAAPWSAFLGEQARQAHVPAIRVTSNHTYTRVVVRIDMEELEPNPKFVQDVRNAMASPSKEAKLANLRKALYRWGALIPTYVHIGCSLVSNSTFFTPGDIPSVSLFFSQGSIASHNSSSGWARH
jgi:hypothetical protein